MDDNFRIQWTTIPHLLDESSASLDETSRRTHKEYEHEARTQNKMPYAYRTFCEKYGQYGKKYKLTITFHRKPGEIFEVDWAGSTLTVKDSDNGQDNKIYIFVATWPFS